MNFIILLTLSARLSVAVASIDFDERIALGTKAIAQKDYRAASEHLQAARQLAEGMTAKTATAISNLAALDQILGRVSSAVSGYREALRQWDSLGIQNEGMRTTLRNLADSLRQMGEIEESRQVLKRLGALLEADAVPNREAMHRLRLSLARIEEATGQTEKAEKLYREVLGGEPEQSSVRAAALDGAGDAALKGGRFKEAEEYFAAALAIWEESGNLIRAASSSNRLGDRWLSERQPKRAVPYLKRSLAIFEQEGVGGAQLASVLNNLGQAHRFAGNAKAAEEYFDKAIATATRELGAEHPVVAAIQINKGNLAMSRKKYGDAEVFLRQALAIDERRLGRNHPDIARDLAQLAMLHVVRKQYDAARQELGDALAILEGCKTPLTIEQASWFEMRADLLRRADNYAEAAKLEAVAMRIRVKQLLR